MSYTFMKVLIVEHTVTTVPDDCNKARKLRLYTAVTSLLTIKNASGVTVGTITLVGGTDFLLAKDRTDTIESSGTVLATQVSTQG